MNERIAINPLIQTTSKVDSQRLDIVFLTASCRTWFNLRKLGSNLPTALHQVVIRLQA